jgi:uncharacterized protein YqcC (DUF446 family)
VRHPDSEALASTQPFAMDTLSLPQWLQFIFIPRMYALVESRAALPHKCRIAPMAEEYFRGRGRGMGEASLIAVLESIDTLLSLELPNYGLRSEK